VHIKKDPYVTISTRDKIYVFDQFVFAKSEAVSVIEQLANLAMK
jgi:hypothetical protein